MGDKLRSSLTNDRCNHRNKRKCSLSKNTDTPRKCIIWPSIKAKLVPSYKHLLVEAKRLHYNISVLELSNQFFPILSPSNNIPTQHKRFPYKLEPPAQGTPFVCIEHRDRQSIDDPLHPPFAPSPVVTINSPACPDLQSSIVG